MVLAPISSDRSSMHRKLTMQQWTVPEFEIDSDQPEAAAGIDGEAVTLQAPLRFRVRPGALRVRIAPQHPRLSPSALAPENPWQMLPTLVRLALRGAPTGST
jgi:hypothetical protein